VTASDDAKFERARREAPHIEAFATLKPSPEPELHDPPRVKPRTWQEMRDAWNAYDEKHRAGHGGHLGHGGQDDR
jgi:hypothetical protein